MHQRIRGKATALASAPQDTESFRTMKLATPSTFCSGRPASLAALRHACAASDSTERPEFLLKGV